MTETNFLGIPVEGEVNHNRRSRTEQKGKDELRSVLQPLLDHSAVEAVRWEQYTPYFNDGDVCEFSIRDPEFKFAGVPEGAGDYGDGFVNALYTDEAVVVGLIGSRDYDSATRSWVTTEGSDPALANAVKEFAEIASGAFDDLLLESFGDHAQVTVTAEKITVDFYEHD